MALRFFVILLQASSISAGEDAHLLAGAFLFSAHLVAIVHLTRVVPTTQPKR